MLNVAVVFEFLVSHVALGAIGALLGVLLDVHPVMMQSDKETINVSGKDLGLRNIGVPFEAMRFVERNRGCDGVWVTSF